jgi:hypothetical protein
MSAKRIARPYDFTYLPQAPPVPELSIATARALLLDRAVSATGGSATVRVDASVTSKLDLAHHVRIPTPLDDLVVSVSHPVVTDEGLFVAGVLFRRAHDVVPSASGDGAARFGSEHVDDTFSATGPPLPGAVAQFEFSPPRANKRYLLEYACFGDSVRCKGSDGSSHQSNGPFAVVLFSTASSVTYTLNSSEHWWFRSCRIRWVAD